MPRQGFLRRRARAGSCLSQALSNFLHKSLLLTERHAENALQGKELREIQNMLLPVMAPRYYANLYGNEGVRSPGHPVEGDGLIRAGIPCCKACAFRGAQFGNR